MVMLDEACDAKLYKQVILFRIKQSLMDNFPLFGCIAQIREKSQSNHVLICHAH